MSFFPQSVSFAVLAGLIFSIMGCATTPTGRKQLTLMPKDQLAALGQDSFSQLKSKSKLSKDQEKIRKVNCVTRHILKSNGENPSDWEVEVFDDKSPNAFALPGGKI